MTEKTDFSVWTLVALVVGNAVGAGIYTTSGFALADLGSIEWVLLAWLVAGLIALAGALSYGMLVRGITESGGEYLFLSRSIHPLAGFIAGWTSLLAGFPGAIAFAALALEAYTRSSIDQVAVLPPNLLAITVTVAAGVLHIVRVRAGARAHEWIVGFMLLVLIGVIGWAGWHILSGAESSSHGSGQLATFDVFAFASSLVWISLSYSGFNAAAYVAGEVDNAEVKVPQAMVIGTLITLILCVAINAVMLYSADPELLRGAPDIAARAAQALGGVPARRLLELVIVVSLLTSITAMVLAGPRVYAKMADEGALPGLFRARRGNPPRMSIVLQVTTAVLLIVLTDLRGLMSYLGFTLSLCLALAVSSLFVRHWRYQERPDSAWYPVVPAIFVACTVMFALLSAWNNHAQLYAAIPAIAIGTIAYFVVNGSRKSEVV